MIKKVALFECHRDPRTKNYIELSGRHRFIFNPNSKYTSAENWIRNTVSQKIDNGNIKLNDCKIHFLSNCTVPRNKIKEFCEQNNIKVVRDYTKAEYLVFSNDTINKASSYAWYNKVETIKFVNFLLDTKNQDLITSEQYNEAISCIENAEYKDKVLLDYQMRRAYHDYELSKTPGVKYPSSERYVYIEDDKICSILSNLDSNNFIHQDYILQKLNTSNIVDEEVYKSIQTLLQSNDESNHCIAMEIMANSDYDKSCYYLLKIFQQFNRKFFYSKYKNHVNFKALVNYLGININNQSMDLDNIIFIMKNKGVFTQKYYDMLSTEYVDEVAKYMERGRFNYVGINSKNPFYLNVEVDPEPVNDTVNQEPCLNLETQTS